MIIPLSSALLDSSNNYKWTNSSAASAAALSYIGHTVCASTEKLVSTREVLVLATFRHQLAILKPLYSYKIKNSKIFIDVYFWYQTSNLLKSIISNKIDNCKKTSDMLCLGCFSCHLFLYSFGLQVLWQL